MIRRLKDESGYSLVEVMVAIMILAIAIIPMVGMFDAGLRAASTGSNYDKARALAARQLETAKNLPYATVRDNFPNGTGAPPNSGLSAGIVQSSGQTDTEFPGFTYQVRKAYALLGSSEVKEDPTGKTMMAITVTVNWGSGSSYSATGLVAK